MAAPRLLDERRLAADADAMVGRLKRLEPHVVALLADNGPGWLATDQAARRLGVPMVPVPTFFSRAQVDHVLQSSGADVVVTDRNDVEHWLDGEWRPGSCQEDVQLLHRERAPIGLPPGTGRITFTSGSTGNPKGVCLGFEQLDRLAEILAGELYGLGVRRHVCALPLAVLLEEVAGAATARRLGAELVMPCASEMGFDGGGAFDALRFSDCLAASGAQSVILLPEMLKALVHLGEAGHSLPASLKFVAVGGARVGSRLIGRGRALGLPVYEGYGLSECGSVVSLNRPGADRPGSAGRPLPHAAVSVGEDGEIRVAGAVMLGYVGGAGIGSSLPTGDLGHLDKDGFLWVSGRRDNRYATSYGRNISPEWPESLLLASRHVAQAVVFGESMPFNVAVIVAARSAIPDVALGAAVARANEQLPGYARIHQWIRAAVPFTSVNGQATANGRVRRDVVRRRYADAIRAIRENSEAANGIMT